MIPTDRILMFIWFATRAIFILALTLWMVTQADARRRYQYRHHEPERKVWPIPGIAIWYPCWNGSRVIREASPELRLPEEGCYTWVQYDR